MKKNSKTVIIAEIGVNHNGILKNAKSLALKSKKIGALIAKIGGNGIEITFVHLFVSFSYFALIFLTLSWKCWSKIIS